MSNQNDNNNNDNTTSNNPYEGMELFEEDIRRAELARESNKRARDDDDNENPESKRQREDDSNESDYVSSENSSEPEDSDSVSDNGEMSETDRINTKYSKRFDAIEDYKEKNKLLSEECIKDVMNKLDKDEELSTEELATLNRAFKLMDKSIPNDIDSLERMQLYEAFSGIVPSEISENNERIAYHEQRLAEYRARLDEINREKSEMSSNSDSSDSDFNNLSNAPSPDDDDSDKGNEDGSDDDNDGDDEDSGDDENDGGFDDFLPSFDFDDF
jgi:uncharacterized protein YktA (UPF0223 family)